MSVTPGDRLAGVLPVVISGGRPALKERPTALLLPGLAGVTADPVWVVRDDDAAGYERDGHELAVYSRDWAEEYAAGHWTAPGGYRPGMFLGAFTGREWACRLATQRGYWAVMQLDDNIERITMYTNDGCAARIVRENGGLGLFADLLAAVTLATNSRMTGAALTAVDPSAEVGVLARAGFPYSLFTEQMGEGREEWLGPAEDDIMHAWQYASRADAATAAVVLPLRYRKRHWPADGTGMRGYYTDHKRSVGLQRMAPEMARLVIKTRYANGMGSPRVFHHMRAGAIAAQTPLAVTGHDLMDAAAAWVRGLTADMAVMFAADTRARIARRARQAEARGAGQ